MEAQGMELPPGMLVFFCILRSAAWDNSALRCAAGSRKGGFVSLLTRRRFGLGASTAQSTPQLRGRLYMNAEAMALMDMPMQLQQLALIVLKASC